MSSCSADFGQFRPLFFRALYCKTPSMARVSLRFHYVKRSSLLFHLAGRGRPSDPIRSSVTRVPPGQVFFYRST